MKFVSVDIDYWYDLSECQEYIAALVKLAVEKNANITAVTNHQQMLRHVNRSSARTLWNVDAHSDLCDKTVCSLDCGTWVSFVKWRGQGEYIWCCQACDKLSGDCNGGKPIFKERSVASIHSWKQVSRKTILPNPAKLIQNCQELSFCVSPSYALRDVQRWFKYFANKNKIRISPGANSQEEIYGIDHFPNESEDYGSNVQNKIDIILTARTCKTEARYDVKSIKACTSRGRDFMNANPQLLNVLGNAEDVVSLALNNDVLVEVVIL